MSYSSRRSAYLPLGAESDDNNHNHHTDDDNNDNDPDADEDIGILMDDAIPLSTSVRTLPPPPPLPLPLPPASQQQQPPPAQQQQQQQQQQPSTVAHHSHYQHHRHHRSSSSSSSSLSTTPHSASSPPIAIANYRSMGRTHSESRLTAMFADEPNNNGTSQPTTTDSTNKDAAILAATTTTTTVRGEEEGEDVEKAATALQRSQSAPSLQAFLDSYEVDVGRAEANRSPESTALLGESPETPDAKDKLTTFQKVAYGFPQFNLNYGNFMINTWLIYSFLPPDGEDLIPAGIFGTIFTVGRMLNATCDPLVGYVSDHTKGKAAVFGRRKPYMFIGAPFLALSFAMLWFVPDDHATTLNTVYFITVFMVYNICYSVCVAPYTALLPEICSSNSERVRVATYSGLFALLGNLAAAAIGPIQSAFKTGVEVAGFHFDNGLQLCGVFGAIFHIVGIWLIAMIIKESNRAPLIRPNLFKEMWTAFRNPAFISLIGVSVLLPMGIMLVTAGLPYLCTEILETDDGLVEEGKGETWVGILSFILIAGALLWMPFISLLVKRFGKKKIMLLCGAFMSFCTLFISVVQFFPDPAVPVLIGVFLLSLPATASFVLPSAIYGDVVDFDHQRTGQRREGIYAGMQSFCNKSGWAISSALVVYLLSFDGDASSLGSASASTMGISLIFVLAGVIVGLGTCIFATHPIKN